MSQQKNLSIFYIYEEYIKQQKENNVGKMLNTALLRYLIPYWGGKFPQGKRCSPQEIEEGLSLLGTLPINLLLDAIDVAEEAFVSQSVTLPNRRVYRSILKNFLDWSKTKDYFVIETESNTKTKTKRRGRTRVNPRGIRFYNNAGKPKKDWNTGFHNKIAFKKPYALMALNNRGKQVYPNDYINSKLQDELTRFERFLSLDGLRKVTIESYFTRVKQFLGWLHRCKNIPLEDLRLNLIIPYCQLNIELNEDDDWNKFAILKHKTGQKANEIANQCIDMLVDYFTFLNKHPNTELEVLKVFIRLGQFIYREEIGTNEYPTIKNIPVLAKITNLRAQTYKRSKDFEPSIPHSDKCVSWKVVLDVLEALRREADTEYGYRGIPRKKEGIMNSLQDFLSLAFFVVIPPLRSRVFYQLEIGRTFVKGAYIDGVFVPEEKFKEAQISFWYIQLSDYKTSKFYGKWSIKIPNLEFDDGKKLYEYIDKWLKEGRECKAKCEHSFFFRCVQSYKPFRDNSLTTQFAHFFYRHTNVPVTPKELRKIYVTFLKDSGASEAVLEGAACALQHSRKMQSSEYDQQEQFKKMAPVIAFHEQALKGMLLKNQKSHKKVKAEEIQNITFQSEKTFTRLNLTSRQALEEVKRLQKMNMNQEQIIGFLWDATPRARKKYQSAIAEFEEIIKG